MYRVMLIDDEKALRNLLKKTISWEEKGLIVAGEAASGIEAINTIDEIQPDIAFVDIRMPFMDGIEFSKLAIKRYPALKILILTAFDDFSYAKECIGIGVCQYLLKPIVRKDISEALDQVIGQLNQEGRNHQRADSTEVTKHLKIAAILEYMNQHYADPDLNLTYAAELFGFNVSYLSRRFKEEVGTSFIDYLTQIRMEKACLLAATGELMYRTAELVGIPDPNYFGKCFKRSQGIAYSDYMRKLSK